MKRLVCPKHKLKMFRKQWGGKWYYLCVNYPECDIKAALHRNGQIMSYPADKRTRDLRHAVHREAERIWGVWTDPFTDKIAMYKWLEQNTSEGHIGKLYDDELKKVLKQLQTMKSRRVR